MTGTFFTASSQGISPLIAESRAIVRYLEAKYKGSGTQLVPTDLKAYGIAEQGAYLESQSFEPPATLLLRELVFRKYVSPQTLRSNE